MGKNKNGPHQLTVTVTGRASSGRASPREAIPPAAIQQARLKKQFENRTPPTYARRKQKTTNHSETKQSAAQPLTKEREASAHPGDPVAEAKTPRRIAPKPSDSARAELESVQSRRRRA